MHPDLSLKLRVFYNDFRENFPCVDVQRQIRQEKTIYREAQSHANFQGRTQVSFNLWIVIFLRNGGQSHTYISLFWTMTLGHIVKLRQNRIICSICHSRSKVT